jgi:membrane protease YdiL (CAAX protease family)
MNLRNKPLSDNAETSERWKFLRLSLMVEGGLTVVALGSGWLFGLPLWDQLKFSFEGFAIGIAGTIPLLIMLRLMYFSKASSLLEIRQMLLEFLGKSLSSCGWLDMCIVALLAGVSEECLFRGALEPMIGRWNPTAALLICNVVFGLCHAVTPLYFAYAMLLGIYLSYSLKWTHEPNLIIPITIHALYDLVAFAVIRREYRQSKSGSPVR